MKDKKTKGLIIALVLVAAGFGVGYAVGKKKGEKTFSVSIS